MMNNEMRMSELVELLTKHAKEYSPEKCADVAATLIRMEDEMVENRQCLILLLDRRVIDEATYVSHLNMCFKVFLDHAVAATDPEVCKVIYDYESGEAFDLNEWSNGPVETVLVKESPVGAEGHIESGRETSPSKPPSAIPRGADAHGFGGLEVPVKTPRIVAGQVSRVACFISHSAEDSKFAVRLHGCLNDLGIRSEIGLGLPSPNALHRGREQSRFEYDKVLLCVSENSIKSSLVSLETEILSSFEPQLRRVLAEGCSVVPLMLDGYLDSGRGRTEHLELVALFADFVRFDFSGCENDFAKFDRQFELLARFLGTDGNRIPGQLPKLPR